MEAAGDLTLVASYSPLLCFFDDAIDLMQKLFTSLSYLTKSPFKPTPSRHRPIVCTSAPAPNFLLILLYFFLNFFFFVLFSRTSTYLTHRQYVSPGARLRDPREGLQRDRHRLRGSDPALDPSHEPSRTLGIDPLDQNTIYSHFRLT